MRRALPNSKYVYNTHVFAVIMRDDSPLINHRFRMIRLEMIQICNPMLRQDIAARCLKGLSYRSGEVICKSSHAIRLANHDCRKSVHLYCKFLIFFDTDNPEEVRTQSIISARMILSTSHHLIFKGRQTSPPGFKHEVYGAHEDSMIPVTNSMFPDLFISKNAVYVLLLLRGRNEFCVSFGLLGIRCHEVSVASWLILLYEVYFARV